MTQDRDRSKLYKDVWRNVWLRRDISKLLTSNILDGSGGKFHGSASLLLLVLQTQIIYQQYRNTVSAATAEKEIRPDILLSCGDVTRIIEAFSKCLVHHSGTEHTSSIDRALQLRVLASSLWLLQLLGTTHFRGDFHGDLRSEITERLKDIKNARASARKEDGGREIYSFGDAELFAQFSLGVLSQMPSDVGQAVPIIRGIANAFFAVGLIYTYNIPQAIDCLAVWNDLPSNPGAWYKPFHELYSIALGAVCLSHHGQANSNPDFSSLAVQTALDALRQLAKDFREELSRLTASPRMTGILNWMRNSRIATNLFGPGSERWMAAFGMLFIVNMLAEAPCGKNSQFSMRAKSLAIATIKRCQPHDELAMLRFKAFEILLSLQETCGHSELEINFEEVSARPKSTPGKIIRNKPKSVSEMMHAEGKASEERFRFKRACDIASMGFCLDEMREKEVEEPPGPAANEMREKEVEEPPGPAADEMREKEVEELPGPAADEMREKEVEEPPGSSVDEMREKEVEEPPGPAADETLTTPSMSTPPATHTQWQEPAPRIGIVQAIPDKKPREFDFRSVARSVVLSPDKRFAVFAFEKKIRVGSLVGFPAGSTKVDAPIVEIWPTAQRIKAVAVSSEVLVVASEGEVRVCQIDRNQTSPGSYVNTKSAMSLPGVCDGARITSIAISHDSSLIAVGQRIDVHKGCHKICEGVVQLYSREPLSDRPYCTSGRLSLGEGAEPAHVTISPDTTTVLCAHAASLYTWHHDPACKPAWHPTRIESLELTLSNRHNPGCRGITSITVFSAPADPDRAYCILTAILSAIPEENTNATILAPLDETAPDSPRCYYPVPDSLARAAVSDTADIAVFLSDTAQLRVCRLALPHDGGSGLLIHHPEAKPGQMGPGHRLEPRLCARLGVRTNGQDRVVVGVEPDGKVWETRIKVSRFERESEPAELMAGSPVLLGD